MTLESYMDKFHMIKEERNIQFILDIPDELKNFISQYEGAELPFGYIFDYKTMQELSQEQPFDNRWLAFGKDNYFSYWCCKIGSELGEAVYTTWDHEAGADIDKPVYNSLVDFLCACEEEYDEFEDTVSEYEAILYHSCNLKTLMQIKNELGLNITSKNMLEKSKHCPSVLGLVSHKKAKYASEETKKYIYFRKM